VNFHRYYDLTERVLNGRDLTLDKTRDDFYEWATIRSLQQQGIGTVGDIADYYRLKKTSTQAVLKALLARDEVIALTVAESGKPVYIHRDDWALMEEVAAGQHPAQVTTFLSPFDNLIWYRDRTEALFNFHYRVEMYTPAAKRRYGYYVLPVLHNGRLIGRIDPKIERKTGTFIIRALHLEPDTVVDAGLVAGLRGAIAEFMAFHQCQQFVLESCEDPTLRDGLRDVALG
jgi:hypothetical protein